MKIYVRKNAGAQNRKYRMEMQDEEDVYDLMEKCREKWKINEDTALFCSDEAGAEYDTDVKLSKLEGKVLIVRQNQEEEEVEEEEKNEEEEMNEEEEEENDEGSTVIDDYEEIDSMLGTTNLCVQNQDGLAELKNRDESFQPNTAVNIDCPIQDEEAFLQTQVSKLNNYGLKGIKYVAIPSTLCDDDGSKEKTLEFSSETENQEKKSHIASVENFKSWDVEGHINCLGVASVHGGGGRSNSDVKQEGSKSEERKQTTVAVVERWGFQTLKKFKVEARLQKNLLLEVKQLAKLPANNQIEKVEKFMRKYCGHVFEGSCYIGGYFQMRATTRSKGQANFLSLVNVAKKELTRHWEMGAGVDGTLLGVPAGVGASGGQLSRRGNSDNSNSSSESTESKTMTNIEIESKPGNCKNMNEIVSQLGIPSKWTVFRDPEASKEDFIQFHEILRRNGDRDIVRVADIIKELAAAEERKRLVAAEKEKEEMNQTLVSELAAAAAAGYYAYLILTKKYAAFSKILNKK